MASGLDALFTLLVGDLVVPALGGEHGSVARALVAGFPPVMWTLLLGLGAVYNAIVTHEGEAFSAARAALVGVITGFWPYSLIAVLIR